MRSIPALLVLVLAGLAARPAGAHDFWLEPSPYAPPVGSLLRVRLRVGDDLVGEELPRSARRLVRFDLLEGEATRPLLGRDEQSPAGLVRPQSEGLAWVVYRSREDAATVAPATFAAYLESEGHARWLADWKAWDPQQKSPVRELFSRCAKTLLNVGGGAGGRAAAAPGYGRVAGLAYEIVPEANPLALAPGGELPVRLLWDGKPAADAQVRARAAADPTHPVTARTDAEGRARLTLTHAGVWLLTGVHLDKVAPEEGFHYRSTWASLTFEVPAPPAK